MSFSNDELKQMTRTVTIQQDLNAELLKEDDERVIYVRSLSRFMAELIFLLYRRNTLENAFQKTKTWRKSSMN
jgi:hypothetical protein